MTGRYFSRKGMEITYQIWQELILKPRYTTIAEDEIGGWIAWTFWVGTDQATDAQKAAGSPALIFQTVIIPPNAVLWRRNGAAVPWLREWPRFSPSEKEALRMHLSATAAVRKNTTRDSRGVT
jgi:hypothetical protein